MFFAATFAGSLALVLAAIRAPKIIGRRELRRYQQSTAAHKATGAALSAAARRGGAFVVPTRVTRRTVIDTSKI